MSAPGKPVSVGGRPAEASTSVRTLEWIPGHLSVCRCESCTLTSIVDTLESHHDGLMSLTFAPGEISLVCDSDFADSHLAPALWRVEAGWSAFRFAGPLDFGLVGVLADACTVLKKVGVTVYAISTYDTDYLLVKTARAADAQAALEVAGYRFVAASRSR